MANGWNSESDREAMLRRVAIVLSSLPGPVASQLMGSIGAESKKAVRRTMTSLADVDPLERKRALQAFKVSVEQRPLQTQRDSQSSGTLDDRFVQQAAAASTSKVVSSVGGNVRRHTAGGDSFENNHSAAGQATANDASPLRFLDTVDDDALVNLLAVEHPQTIALVLASITPAHAARILPRLNPSLQSDALSRIGRLGDIPEAAAAEVAAHFKNCLAHQNNNHNDRSGRRALDAILAAMPSPPAITDPTPARRPAPAPPDTPQPQPAPIMAQDDQDSPTHAPVAPISFPSADIPAVDLTHKLRVATDTWPENAADQHAGRATDAASGPRSDPSLAHSATETVQTQHVDKVSQQGVLHLDSTDAIHQHLLGLTPIELCRALAKVETREAMLVLCGLPNEVAESALAVLPRSHAKKVRIKMNALGSLHLREIDEAKEKVARLSRATNEETSNPIPTAA